MTEGDRSDPVTCPRIPRVPNYAADEQRQPSSQTARVERTSLYRPFSRGEGEGEEDGEGEG